MLIVCRYSVKFHDRLHAGSLLAAKMCQSDHAIVLGLARGGLVVGAALAKPLNLPLDVLVVKKVSSTQNIELALGAVTLNKTSWIDWRLVDAQQVAHPYIDQQIEELSLLVEEKTILYRVTDRYALGGHSVILVDDGIATGATVRAALVWLRKVAVKKITLAVPVIASESFTDLQHEVDVIQVLHVPLNFHAVGEWYEHFEQVPDEDMIQLLSQRKSH